MSVDWGRKLHFHVGGLRPVLETMLQRSDFELQSAVWKLLSLKTGLCNRSAYFLRTARPPSERFATDCNFTHLKILSRTGPRWAAFSCTKDAALRTPRTPFPRQVELANRLAHRRATFAWPQGCQMVCFQTKRPNLGRVLQWKMWVYFMDTWSISWSFAIFYGHLVQFLVVWYILPHFGILYQEKSGNPGLATEQ
jgi:hypothetical protein